MVWTLRIPFWGQIRFKAAFWEAVLGVMERLVLSDAAWARMAPLIIGRPDQKGSTGRDNRMFVEGVLWIVRTGSPWRDLPEAFGDWNSVFRRFSRWSIKGVWWRILAVQGRRYSPALDAFVKVARLRDWLAEVPDRGMQRGREHNQNTRADGQRLHANRSTA